MRLKSLVACSLLIITTFGVFSQSKVAVLDAINHSGVQESVSIPITESIIEALVGAGKYIVLDRAHIAKVMEEQKFQVSGIVKSTDIKKVGEYLGADIIVVINISILEDIYFVSAKMIKVASGEILSQASHKKRGDISVIFDIAEVVGVKLAGTESVGAGNNFVDTDLSDYVGGDLRLIEMEVSPDDYLLFHVSDMMVSGMMDKEIHVEFWISQGEEWMPDSKQFFEPELVMYDPAYWNGPVGTFTYDLFKVQAFGDPKKPYWATFYIINTATDDVIFQKDYQFSLPAIDTDEYDWDFFDDLPTPIPTPAPKVYSRISLNYLYPLFSGNVQDALEDIDWVYDGEVAPTFFDLHILQVIASDAYVSLLAAYNSTYYESYSTFEEGEFLIGTNFQVGLGYLYPIMMGIQGFAGARVGIYTLEQGEVWNDTANSTHTGFSFTVEAGFDLIVFNTISLNIRGQYESAMFESDWDDPEAIFPTIALGTYEEDLDTYFLNAIGFSIGIGWVY